MTAPSFARKGPLQTHAESGTWQVTKRDVRAGALAFCAGRGQWSLSDAVGWAVEHLVEPGRLVARDDGDPLSYFWERDIGLVRAGPAYDATFVLASARAREKLIRAMDFRKLYQAAHARVVANLRRLLERPSHDGFVHAALYAGRVVRVTGGPNRPGWEPRVTCEVPLSDQVLAMFAADILEDRDAYDNDLSVCDTCGAIGFAMPGANTGAQNRFGCAKHTHLAVPHR